MAYKINDYFTYEEFYNSATAKKYRIDNTPDEASRNNIRDLANNVLLPLRKAYGRPIIVTSGYRCPKLNTKVGGAISSLHMNGLAADITDKDKKQNGKLFNTILSLAKQGKIEFRTLIWEKGDSKNPQWVHIDINGAGHTKRKNYVIPYKG